VIFKLEVPPNKSYNNCMMNKKLKLPKWMKYREMNEDDRELGSFLLIILGPFWLLAMILSTLYWG